MNMSYTHALGASSFIDAIFDFIPILKWLPKYSWKESFGHDVIAGLTAGVMFVPQGIAYSYLVGLILIQQ